MPARSACSAKEPLRVRFRLHHLDGALNFPKFPRYKPRECGNEKQLRTYNEHDLHRAEDMPSCQILLRSLQLLVQLPREIVIAVVRFLAQRLIDGKIDFQLVMSGWTGFDMIEKLFQFPVRQFPVQIRSDQLLSPHTIHQDPSLCLLSVPGIASAADLVQPSAAAGLHRCRGTYALV